MKFLLSSVTGEDEQLVENTVIEKYTEIEVRKCSSFEEFDRRFGRTEGAWLSKGENHIAKNGCIEREFLNKKDGYFIEINTIEELMSLKQEIGHELILTEAQFNKNIPCLEIYNGWRE